MVLLFIISNLSSRNILLNYLINYVKLRKTAFNSCLASKFAAISELKVFYTEKLVCILKISEPDNVYCPLPTNFSCGRNVSSVSENSPVWAAPNEDTNKAITRKGEGFYKAD